MCSSQISMSVRKKLTIAQIMPCVPTIMVASHVIVQKVSLEMASPVMVSSLNYEQIPDEII